MTPRGTQSIPFELKKSGSQYQVKIKRESVNFITKEGNSRNSTVRESLMVKSDS